MTSASSVYLRALVFSDLAQTACSFPVFDRLCTARSSSFVNVSSGNLTAFTYDISWLQVQNFCRTDDEEQHVKMTATIETVSSVIAQGWNTGCCPEKLGRCTWAN